MSKYFKEVIYLYVVSVVFLLIGAFASSVIYTMPGYYIDNYDKGFNFLIKMIVITVVSFLVFLLTALVCNIVACYRRKKFDSLIKRDFFNTVLNRDYSYFHKRSVEEYISIQSNDINELCANYLGPVEGLIRSFVLLIVYSVFLFVYVDIRVVIVIVTLSIIALFTPKLTNNWVAFRTSAHFNQLEKYTLKIAMLFRGYDILDKKSTKVFKEQHETTLNKTLELQLRSGVARNIAMVVNGGVSESISVIVFIFGAFLLYNGTLTVGEFVITITYSSMFLDPLHEFNLNVGRIKSVSQIKQKLLKFLQDDEDSFEETSDTNGDIELNDVSVSFKNFTTKSITASFKEGEKYLIAGDNGTGKSTLLKAVMQFNRDYTGNITWNSNSIKNNRVTNVFAYVPQHGYVIDDEDYYSNISLYGIYDITNLSMYEKMFPEVVIDKLKKKDTLKNISGGERQIISLLRALCSEKSVLVLDEPFSAMSKDTYQKCFDGILSTNKTVLLVMHNSIEDINVFNNVIYL